MPDQQLLEAGQSPLVLRPPLVVNIRCRGEEDGADKEIGGDEGAALGHAPDGVLTLVGDLGGEICGPAGGAEGMGAMEGELRLGSVIKADETDKGCGGGFGE